MSPKLAAVTVIGRHLVLVIGVSARADLKEVKSERLDLGQDTDSAHQSPRCCDAGDTEIDPVLRCPVW